MCHLVSNISSPVRPEALMYVCVCMYLLMRYVIWIVCVPKLHKNQHTEEIKKRFNVFCATDGK